MRSATTIGLAAALTFGLVGTIPASAGVAGDSGAPHAAGHASTGAFAGRAPLLGAIAAPGERGGVDVAATLGSRGAQTVTVTRATTIDDRGLVRRTTGWKSVSSSTAVSRTLTCSVRKGGYVRTKVGAATTGGSVRLKTGPSGGTAIVRTAGVKRATRSTLAKKSSFVWVAFKGAGLVDVVITVPGRAGVCVDAVKLNAPPVPALLPGALRQLDLSTTGHGANDAIVNAAVSPRGSMLAYWSRGTNLVAGVTDGFLHLFVASVATGRVVAVADTDASGVVLANDGDPSGASRALTWAPVETGYTDSRFIAFGSQATNLTPTLPAGSGPFLFAKNLLTDGIVGLVGGVGAADWSPDGTKIAFVTSLVYGGTATDPNFDDDIWSLDLNAPVSANLTSVSSNAAGHLPNEPSAPTGSFQPAWSPDSKRVMFNSFASTLVPGDTNKSRDIFIKNVATQAIVRVSTSSTGAQGNSYSESGSWSPDGTRIAFTSMADNLVVGDVNSDLSVFTKVLATGAVKLVSTTSKGTTAFFASSRPHWSPDGTRIAYMSKSVDLLPAPLLDTNTVSDVYIKNLVTGLNQIVSITADKRFGNSYSSVFEIGGFRNNAWLPNGKGLVFASDSSNLAATDANAFGRDLFIKAL